MEESSQRKSFGPPAFREGTITQLQQQHKDPKRVSIFIDGELFCWSVPPSESKDELNQNESYRS